MPDTLTAPPPAVPASSPAAAPAEKAPADYLGDIVGDLQDMDAGKPPTPHVDQATAKPTDKPVDKPAAKPQEKAPEKALEKPPEEPPKPVKAAELRTAYEGLKKRVKEEFEPELQKLRSKVSDLESRKPEDSAPVLAKVQTLEKRNAELEQLMAYHDYKETSDYKKSFEQPLNDAWVEALNTFQQLQVSERFPDGEDDMGQPKFKIIRRPATDQDLRTLAFLPLQEMYDAAHEKFGNASSEVIGQLRDIRKLYAAKEKAESDASIKSKEWKSQRQLEDSNGRKQRLETWQNINKSLEEKFPKAFKIEEGNEADKTAHTRGFALADLLFKSPGDLTPEQVEALPPSFRDSVKANQPLSEVQKVQLHAIARLKIANHDRKVVALKVANERIAELEKSLSEFEKSSPPGGRAGAGGHVEHADPMTEAEQELRALDK
jgi:hypothetical protein